MDRQLMDGQSASLIVLPNMVSSGEILDTLPYVSSDIVSLLYLPAHANCGSVFSISTFDPIYTFGYTVHTFKHGTRSRQTPCCDSSDSAMNL